MKTKLFVLLLILSEVTTTFGQTASYTQLSVKNQQPQPVKVYVTFADTNQSNKCAPNPAGLADFPFLKPVNRLVGTFTLGAGATKNFDPKGKCFSGNICFNIQPQCPVKNATFPNGKQGTSIAEFTLNPNQGCAEAFDISCVNGVNSFIKITTGSNGWTYGPDSKPIDTIYNKGLTQNKGLPGVYPVNCTDCIKLVGCPPCPTLSVGPAQTSRICNVQRNGRGGILQIILLSNANKSTK